MGELLVAQGFTDRAIVVYEELVRRRPNDPLLSARLAALRATHAPPAESMLSTYTARERFTALAARRLSRRTPPYAAPLAASVAPPASVPAATSLAALFGGEAPPRDDTAARALAQAFAPYQVGRAAGPESLPVTFFGRERREPSSADGAGRQPSPGAADDLAHFSDWLKGLGNS